tara:strand:+ start:2237 stop:3850 length:1614 start_codon:yes stop_codon:yes gene_type:complete
MKLQPREYQKESIDAVNEALRTRDDNPAIVLPTGAGKSLVMALLVEQWLSKCPHLKVMVLAHRKELVEQNALELQGVNPDIDVGVFAASLRRRETNASVTFASIDSVAKRSEDFPPQHVLLIDEAHRIPVKGEGKYRKFIDAMKARSAGLRVVGLTATPYRMGTGAICHEDHILNHVAYEAQVGELITSGFLSDIKTVEGEHSALDLSGVKKVAGEFNLKDLAFCVDKQEVVEQAVKDLTSKVRSQNRKSTIVFCIDIEHCKSVQRELRKYGVDAPYIVGKTPIKDRDRIVQEFKAGKYQWLLSVDCFFEGFNAKRVDCVVMLRPTQSKGLWVQAIGRGLRLHPEKDYCLVLDYGENITRHGPIDWNEEGEIRLATCDNCSNVFSRATRKCPSCGWVIPPLQRQMFETEEKERAMHQTRAHSGQLLAKPIWMNVSSVQLRLHSKAGKPSSVRVEYFCGMSIVKDWLLLDHGSYAKGKTNKWLTDRGLPLYDSSADMIRRCTGAMIMETTRRVKVCNKGKYLSVLKVELEIHEEFFEV